MSVIEDKKRRQMIKVLIAEAAMILAVVAIVVVATLASMGFFVSSDGSIEQSGLVQIHSMPTGASVTIDGDTIFSRTNLSRTIAEGEHELKIARDGYDEWSKMITMRPGILLRLYYPRLFLLNRKQEEVKNLGQELAFFTTSNDRTSILYATKTATKWQWLDIKGDEVKTTELDMADVLPGVKEGEFLGKVDEIKWSGNGDHVIAKISYDGSTEWISINLKDLKNSLNLTKTFGMEFEQVEMADGSAGKIFVLENQHLRRINTSDQEISRVLLADIESFMNDGANIIYTTAKRTNEEDGAEVKQIGIYRDGEKGGTVVATAPSNKRVRVALTNYYGDNYLGYTVDDELSILYGTLPTYNESGADLSGLKTLYDNEKITSKPESLSISPGNGYVVAKNGDQFSVVSLETMELYQYESEAATLKWLDDDIMYTTQDGGLIVWDFDNTNKRQLVKLETGTLRTETTTTELDTNNANTGVGMQVTTLTKQPLVNYMVTIADNNKWMYYVVLVEEQGLSLQREKIRE